MPKRRNSILSRSHTHSQANLEIDEQWDLLACENESKQLDTLHRCTHSTLQDEMADGHAVKLTRLCRENIVWKWKYFYQSGSIFPTSVKEFSNFLEGLESLNISRVYVCTRKVWLIHMRNGGNDEQNRKPGITLWLYENCVSVPDDVALFLCCLKL